MKTSLWLIVGLALVLQPVCAVDEVVPPMGPANAASIQATVEAAVAAGQAKVIIPAGTYQVPVKDGWHLRFKGLHDLEIDATGVTLVLADPYASGIAFIGCRNVTFRGARIQRAHPANSQAVIKAVDPKGEFVDIQVDKGYPDDLKNREHFPNFWAALFDPARQMVGGMRAKTPPEIESLPSGLFRIHLYDTVPKIKAATGIDVVPGMSLAWRGLVKDDIRPGDCEGMKFIDITVAGGSGMVFHEMGGKGGNAYTRCTVTYAPTPAGADTAPLFATCADGLHSHDVETGPQLDHCLFEGINDDAIAIHGTYAMAAELDGTRLVAWVFHETRDKLYCRPGETLRFYHPQGTFAGEAVVVSVKPLPGYKPAFKPGSVYRDFQEPEKDQFVEVTLDRAAPKLPVGSLLSNANRTGSGYVIRDCTVRNSSSRGVMAKGSQGLIEGCTFENLGRAGVEFMAEMEVWSESDYARDVVVRHNVFRHVALNRSAGYLRHPGALTIFNFHADSPEPDLTIRKGSYVAEPGGHRHITIEGNRFEEINGPNILVTSAQDVTIRDNRFIRPMEADKQLGAEKGIEVNSLLWFTQCSGLQLSGNEVIEPGPFLKHLVTATDTARGTGFDTGIREEKPAPTTSVKN